MRNLKIHFIGREPVWREIAIWGRIRGNLKSVCNAVTFFLNVRIAINKAFWFSVLIEFGGVVMNLSGAFCPEELAVYGQC